VVFRLRPVDTSFYDLFSEAAQHLVIGAGLLAEMLAETSDKIDVAARMRAAEHDADETTHAIVMDEMDEAVDLILLYEVKAMPPELSEQVEVLQQCAELTAAAMPNLRSMQELDEYWIEINRLENAGDRNHRRILAGLFSGGYKTIEVLKLKDIVDSLESAIDAFEKVANTVEQIAVKES
jgi:uncharacterized protein Yka (UPF0111/DUF47 family)